MEIEYHFLCNKLEIVQELLFLRRTASQWFIIKCNFY